MPKSTSRFANFRDKVVYNSTQSHNKAASYGHLRLPRGLPVFKELPNTRVSLDFLPYVVTDANHPDKDEERGVAVKGSDWYMRPYRLHRNIGPENEMAVCPVSIGKKCPICEARSKLISGGARWDDDAVKALKPTDRVLYIVVPRDDKKLEEKPHIWDMSRFLFQDKLNNELNESLDNNFGNFASPVDGLTLKIRFSQESFSGNPYAETSRIDFMERDYAYDDKTIDELPSLDEVLIVKDYKELQRMLAGGDDDEDEEVQRPTRPIHMRRQRDEEEDEPEEPRRPTRARRPDPDEEEESEEEPEEESEEEPEGEEEGDEPVEVEEEEEEPRVARRMRTVPKAAAERPARTASRPAQTTRPMTRPKAPMAEPELTKPRRMTRGPVQSSPPVQRAAVADGTCPSGFVFGRDCDRHVECNECPVWSACNSAAEHV